MKPAKPQNDLTRFPNLEKTSSPPEKITASKEERIASLSQIQSFYEKGGDIGEKGAFLRPIPEVSQSTVRALLNKMKSGEFFIRVCSGSEFANGIIVCQKYCLNGRLTSDQFLFEKEGDKYVFSKRNDGDLKDYYNKKFKNKKLTLDRIIKSYEKVGRALYRPNKKNEKESPPPQKRSILSESMQSTVEPSKKSRSQVSDEPVVRNIQRAFCNKGELTEKEVITYIPPELAEELLGNEEQGAFLIRNFHIPNWIVVSQRMDDGISQIMDMDIANFGNGICHILFKKVDDKYKCQLPDQEMTDLIQADIEAIKNSKFTLSQIIAFYKQGGFVNYPHGVFITPKRIVELLEEMREKYNELEDFKKFEKLGKNLDKLKKLDK